MKKFVLAVALFWATSCIAGLAQNRVSVIASVTPADTSQCTLTKAYYGYPTHGWCDVPVNWNHAMPSSLYAISCTPETAPDGAYLEHPQIRGVSRADGSFHLVVDYAQVVTGATSPQPGSVAMPGDCGSGPNTCTVYIYREKEDGSTGTPYDLNGLGTINVDCVASAE